MGHEDPAERGRHDRQRRYAPEVRPEGVGQGPAQARGEVGIHENAGTLQVAGRVQARGQQEVSLEKSPSLAEEGQEIRRFGGHGRHVTRGRG